MKTSIYPVLMLLLTPIGFTTGTIVWTSDITSNQSLLIAIFGLQSLITFPILWFAPQLKAGMFSTVLNCDPADYIVPDHGVRLITTFLLGFGLGTVASCIFGGFYSFSVGILQCLAGLVSMLAGYRRRIV